jgi:hypothetical protein
MAKHIVTHAILQFLFLFYFSKFQKDNCGSGVYSTKEKSKREMGLNGRHA